MGNTSIKDLERIGQMEEFQSQDSIDTEQTFEFVPSENGNLPVEESRDQQNDRVKPKKEKRRDSKSKVKPAADSPNKEETELSAEYLEKQIPRKKKAMQIKIRQMVIELHGKNEIISKGKQILDRLTNERERHLERIEEKERAIEGKEFTIQNFHEKMQNFRQGIVEKEGELREKDRLLTEANEQVELLQKQLVGQEEIVKELQAAIENMATKKGSNGFASRSRILSTEVDARVEIESLKRENGQLKLEGREQSNTLKERENLISSLRREKDTLQQEKRDSDKLSLERKFAVDRFNREKERGLAYLGQLEIRIAEQQHALRQAQEESGELRNQMRQKDNILSEKEKSIETLETSRKRTTDRLDGLEKLLQDERQAQRGVCDTLRDEKRACEERLRRVEAELESQQRRAQVLEQEIDRARQSVDIFRKDQPWMIKKNEIILTDKVLGTGAWGTVVEGSFRGTKVAVKELHEIIQSAHNRLLFDREITFATLVRHPCILQFLAVADYRTSSPLLVAELMDMSLSQLVKNEKVLGNRYIRILALDVAYGINYLHCFQPDPIIHRDVNSGNVMVWRQGDKWRGKLCDFGSAEFVGTKMSENPGNPFYSAPEASTSRQSPKMDVYSFGVLLCELCTNKTPNPEERRRQIGLMWNKDLRTLVERCVEEDPVIRASMTGVITVLEPMTD